MTEFWAGSRLKLAHATPDSAVQNRFMAVAQHYRALAVAEQSIADQKGIERRSNINQRKIANQKSGR
jgi:hypothetical protein